MKREWSKSRKLGFKQKIEDWCAIHGLVPDNEGILAFDKAHPSYKLIDHDKAKKEGYYLHIRMQAAALIASWATVEILKVTGNKPQSEAQVRETETRIRLQYSYDIPGKGATPINKMDAGDLKWLISSFRIEAENKMKRAAIIAERLKSLPETRKAFREAYQEAEELVFGNR